MRIVNRLFSRSGIGRTACTCTGGQPTANLEKDTAGLTQERLDAALVALRSPAVPPGMTERLQAQIRHNLAAEASLARVSATSPPVLGRGSAARFVAAFRRPTLSWPNTGIAAASFAACLGVAGWAGGALNLRSASAALHLSKTAVSSASAAPQPLSPSQAVPPASSISNPVLGILAQGRTNGSFGTASAQSLAIEPLRAGNRRGRVQRRQSLAGRATLAGGARGPGGVNALPGTLLGSQQSSASR